MRGREERQDDFLSQAVYDAAILKDHFLRKLKDLLDWPEHASREDPSGVSGNDQQGFWPHKYQS